MTSISSNNLGIAGEIAVLVLNSEQAQQEADRNERNLARAMRSDAAQNEYEALMDSAEALENGALLSGAIAVVGGGVTVVGGFMRVDACGKQELRSADLVVSGGDVISRLAQPANTLVGQSESQEAQARAKRAAFAGEQATWRVDDASEHLSKLARNRDRFLDAIENINQSEQAAENAVVANI